MPNFQNSLKKINSLSKSRKDRGSAVKEKVFLLERIYRLKCQKCILQNISKFLMVLVILVIIVQNSLEAARD